MSQIIMSKFIKDYSKNHLVINLLGNGKDIENATHDIISILDKKNLTHKIIELRPIILSFLSNNKMPEWRFQLAEEMLSPENVIINKIGNVNCDEITDLNRSIRALSRGGRRPISLYVDPDAISRCKQNSNKKQLNECSQITSIFPLNAVFDTKMYEFDIYLDWSMHEIKE
jgi:hypothetical protein